MGSWRCRECGGAGRAVRIQRRFDDTGGARLRVTDVPVVACHDCGRQVPTAAAARALAAAYEQAAGLPAGRLEKSLWALPDADAEAG